MRDGRDLERLAAGLAESVRKFVLGGGKQEMVSAIGQHCGVSPLRAHRIAHGYTLAEVADLLKKILRDSGDPSEGLAHQVVSRWENGQDNPSRRYLDALCFLYRTRPDLLGFGRDYSPDSGHDSAGLPSGGTATRSSGHPLPDRDAGLILPRDLSGISTPGAVELLEQWAEESGYRLYTSPPGEFIPARMADLAYVQALLLRGRSPDLQRRLHRIAVMTAGFIAIRLSDVEDAPEAFNWLSIARQHARRARDSGLEAWIVGHTAYAHACFQRSLGQGLNAAKLAQAANGPRRGPAALFGYLAEAGVQARLGRRRETITAVRQAQRVFEALPTHQVAADGLRVPEYFVCWHQSTALSILGEARLADPLRRRALELPLGRTDLVGRALLHLDKASLKLGVGDVGQGCTLIRQTWEELPQDLKVGQITARTKAIMRNAQSIHHMPPEMASLQEYLHFAEAPGK